MFRTLRSCLNALVQSSSGSQSLAAQGRSLKSGKCTQIAHPADNQESELRRVSGFEYNAASCRCLTDTLVHVPSDPHPEEMNVRQCIFSSILDHIGRQAEFPVSQEGQLQCLSLMSATSFHFLHPAAQSEKISRIVRSIPHATCFLEVVNHGVSCVAACSMCR